MKLKLIASLPGKRLINHRKMCVDGRGGWTLSQLNVNRWITDYVDYHLVFCLGVLVQDACEKDFVEATRLTATMNDVAIGENVREWRKPNAMWGFCDGDAIFEWAQNLVTNPIRDGIIVVGIEAKLHSQPDWLPVSGNAYCRIKKVERLPELDRRWVSRLGFTLRDLIPIRWRRTTNWSTAEGEPSNAPESRKRAF